MVVNVDPLTATTSLPEVGYAADREAASDGPVATAAGWTPAVVAIVARTSLAIAVTDFASSASNPPVSAAQGLTMTSTKPWFLGGHNHRLHNVRP